MKAKNPHTSGAPKLSKDRFFLSQYSIFTPSKGKTPSSNFSRRRDYSLTLVGIHEFAHRLYAKKRTPLRTYFFGAEDEIRTRATVSHTTPLAGEPLEPLGYFCMAQYFFFIQSYITISHFSLLVKAFSRKKNEKFRKFFLNA